MKKFFFPAMLLSAAIVGCAEDESTAVGGVGSINDNGDLVSINVYAGTTKGVDTETSTFEDNKYLLLHIDDSAGDAQSCEFTYEDGTWSQSDGSIKWDDVSFPANFYSLYDEASLSADYITFVDNEDELEDDYAQYVDYTVGATKSSAHKDLVYHASQISAIPTGGVLSVYHKHALSKINLYASTGDYKLYIARVQLVNINSVGTVTITPLTTATDLSTTSGLDWSNIGTSATYQYYYIDDSSDDSSDDEGVQNISGDNVIINESESAPLMIIPQTVTAATITGSDDSLKASISDGSYVEVIYYLTDSNDMPVVGYASVSSMPNGSDYEDEGQVLYVAAGFPLSAPFIANTEYDITLGLGVDGSTGGTLIYDYYVDQDGEPVYLALADSDCDDEDDGGDDSDDDDDDKEIVEIPEIDEGDDILGDGDDEISIIVSAYNWSTGDSVDLTSYSTLDE